MCRIFGFRSVIQSQVHRSLVSADNALAVQSAQHPHGWGVAYYQADTPHLIKSVATAVNDHIFHRVSGVVASETVLAHVRNATVGDVNILNAHPFQFGRWVFAHNGNIPAFEEVREVLRSKISPSLRRFILGDTDSEVLFYLFLTYLSHTTDLNRRGTGLDEVVGALRQVTEVTRALADHLVEDDRCLLTMVVTDGHCMAAVSGGRALLYSTYKSRCLDRDACPFLAPECEAPTKTGFVNHLIISSEKLQGDNQWVKLPEGGVIGVDWRMKLFEGQV